MNSPTIGLRVAAAIFGIIAILQLARFVARFEVTVGGHVLPFWPSAVAFVVVAALGVWMWRLSYHGTK